MRTTHLLTLLCAASLTGCLESEAVLELNPNGGGTLSVDVTLDLASSTERLQAEGVGQQQAAKQAAAELLKRVQGVDCWSDLESEITESGRIHFKGKGWFRDAGGLALEHDGQTLSCALEVGANEGALRLVDERGSRLALALMRYGPRALEQVSRRRFGENPPMLRQLTVQVPGTVKGASYSWPSRDASGAMVEDTPAAWQGLLERYQTRVARLEQAGKLDPEGNMLKQVQLLFAVPKLRWTIDPEAGQGFDAAYAAAVAGWAGSEWKALFDGEAAIASATDPDTTDTPPETTDTGAEATPADGSSNDPFEENDEQVAAKVLEAGKFEDLQADGQDWFQVEIQPGQTLKVGVEKAPAANLGVILLAGGNLRRGSDGVEWANSASQPRMAQFVITGRGFYHLHVAVE